MSISDSLEVAIGLSFIFFLSSLVLASIHEMIEAVLKARGAYLFNGIKELLNDPAIVASGEAAAKQLYQHPLIRGLMRGDVTETDFLKKLPSYLPTQSFALALMDQAAQGKLTAKVMSQASKGTPVAMDQAAIGKLPDVETKTQTASKTLSPLQQLRLTVEGIENQQVRNALSQAIDNATGDIDAARTNLQHWFDSAMDRVSGWYKRRSQWIVFGLGLLTAVCLNVNTVTIAQSLFTSDALRQAVMERAKTLEGTLKACDPGQSCTSTPTLAPSGAVLELGRAELPVGWSQDAITKLLAPMQPFSVLHIILGGFEVLIGYLLTAFAVTLGAPFWFDVLNRLMVIRATVKPTEKSPDEASQDPQAADNTTPVVNVRLPPPPVADTGNGGLKSSPIDRDIYADVLSLAERLFEDDNGKPVSGVTLTQTGATKTSNLANLPAMVAVS